MTRRDRWLLGTVNETISSRPSSAERHIQDRQSGLGCIPAPPMFHCKPPADLDARREVRFKARDRQSNESRKRSNAGNLESPESEAMSFEVLLDPVGGPIALGTSENRGKVLHHPLIRVERRKRGSIRLNPAPQEQPRRQELLRQSSSRPVCHSQ